MALSLDEAARMLAVSPATVRRWAREGLLGVRRPSGEFHFETSQLRRWAQQQGLQLRELHSVPVHGSWPSAPAAPALDPGSRPLTLALGRGGLATEIVPGSVEEVLRQLVDRAPIDSSADPALLLARLLEREALSSTGIGDGIALPHPRQPDPVWCDEATVVVGRLAAPMDWSALDGAPVHTVFLLLNPSPAVHLKVLARLAMVLRDARTQQLLAPDGGGLGAGDAGQAAAVVGLEEGELLRLVAEIEPEE